MFGDPLRSALIRLGLISGLFLAALSSGYALSSTLGQGALRNEAETQLAKWMRGRVSIERADLRIRGGLWIEGQQVNVYPSASGPGLSSKRVAVRIDVIALLSGRFRVQDLILDGIHMEIERSVADRWSPHPIDAIDMRGKTQNPDDLERKLGLFHVIDAIARVLLQDAIIGARVEIKNGSVQMIDRYVRVKGRPPLRSKIDAISGTLEHDWIGNRSRLELKGSLSDEVSSLVPIEVIGEKQPDGSLELSVAVTKIQLESYRAYLQDQSDEARRNREAGVTDRVDRPFSGLLSGVIRFESPEPEHSVIEIDGSMNQAHFGITQGTELLDVMSPRMQLRTRVELHPGRIRISEAELRGPDLRIDVSGDIERPLRESSAANLAVHFHDVGLDALERIARALPEPDRKPLLKTLSTIVDGRIVRVGGKGRARFSVWQDVLRGERLDLPDGLSMMAEVADVTIELSEIERLEDFSGFATWTRDRIHLYRAIATRDGVPTPELNLTIEGFPILLDQFETFDPGRVSNTGLPGMALLDEIFAAEPGPEQTDNNNNDDHPLRIEIDVDYLEHSALLWPLRDAKMHAVLQRRGQSFQIASGNWGGSQVLGDVLVTHATTPTIDAHLKVWRPESAAPVDEAERSLALQPGSAPPRNDAWARGRLLVEGLGGKAWPVGPTVASFAFVDETLILEEVHGQLVPSGTLAGAFELDLARADQLAFDTRFSIRDGEAGRLLAAVGFPDDFATGTLAVDGELKGPIVPDDPAFSHVTGSLDLHSRQGEIRQNIPLAAALAHAAEGLSPARASDALVYESVDTTIVFDRGVITTDEIKLDGPLRIFISGQFDFAKPGRAIDAEIGIFLFRQVDQLLGNVPLLGNLIPGGKDRGLFGAFFEVGGSLDDPVLNALPMKSLTDGVPLPDVVKAPFGAIRQLFERRK
ncbi:MAG: hypothetical protein ACI8W3_000708 [Myxococcota bacterium]